MNVVDGRRPVTIVVPIYDDPEGVVACVESLIANVDLTRDKIILSNDLGPQADNIESLLLQLIGSNPGFSYNRNAENLGFVLNCNRAVLELDRSGNDVLLLNSDTVTTPGFVEELSAVLYSSPRHGVVTARSNNATIASLPDARRVASTRRPVGRSREVHAAVLPHLPRFTIAPVAMGFCFLVRRELIDAHGFFDETFSPGYGEENDFCLRMDLVGYRSVLANRALVFHTGSTSFSGDRGRSLRFAHEKILVERYPFYVGALQLYRDSGRDPVDFFADTFAPGDALRRIAVLLPARPTPTDRERADAVLANLPADYRATLLSTSGRSSGLRPPRRDKAVARAGATDALFDGVVLLGPVRTLADVTAAARLAPRVIVSVPHTGHRGWQERVHDAETHSFSSLAEDIADTVCGSTTIDVVTALANAVEQPIDVARLRRRWTLLGHVSSAAGLHLYPRRASLKRRAALALGSLSPRASSHLRNIVGRR
ncbi:glycosyltransferase family 2 protein [Frigoribacterium sp. ACAM 257]|nr:glycosyltransferase family 2 protein [Frigoribacterium sp. ACAM 257]